MKIRNTIRQIYLFNLHQIYLFNTFKKNVPMDTVLHTRTHSIISVQY